MISRIKLIIIHAIRVKFNLKSVFQFIRLNFLSKNIKGDSKQGNVIIPYPNCVFDLKDTSLITLKAPFVIGATSIKGSKKVSYLYMKEGSHLIINQETTILDGCDIQILENAVCEMGLFHSNTGLEISCGNRICFEGEVTCGHNVRIKDYNGHYVSYSNYPISSPVIIQNHTWLCTGSCIGPGVTIGTGSVVSDNSFVINDIPPKSFCSGNPARIITNNIEFRI